MKTNLKRLVCLLLVFTLMAPYASAYQGPDSGSTVKNPNNAANTGFSSPLNNVGIALGIQQMSGSEYTVKYEDADTLKTREGWEVKSEGLAEVIKHFSYSYPSPYAATGQQGTLFLLPNTSGTQYVYVVQEGGQAGRAAMESHMSSTGSYSPSYKALDDLYETAMKNASETNPNPNLSTDDINRIYASISKSDAEGLIGFIFATTYGSTEFGQLLNEKFRRVYERGVDDMEVELQGIKKACNYAGILLSLTKLLPSGSQEMCKKYVIDYLTNVLGGQPYQPVVVTLETCLGTEWEGDGKYVNWRTMSDHLSLYTGHAPSYFSNPEQMLAGAVSPPWNNNENITQRLVAVAKKTGRGGTTNWGSLHMAGINSKGEDISASYGRRACGITSVSQDALDDVRTHWNLSVPEQGPWGVGIFGVEDVVFPQEVKPPTGEAAFGPVGKISIEVEPVSQTLGVGGYSTNLDFKITVQLDANYATKVKDGDGNITEQEEGAGLVTTLRWLARMKKENPSLPNPKVDIFAYQHEAIPSLSQDATNHLIEYTRGYAGDGPTPAPNYDGQMVSSTSEYVNAGLGSWQPLNLQAQAAFLTTDIPGVKLSGSGGQLTIEFGDLAAAAEYFEKSEGTFVIKGTTPGNGTLETEDSINQHWFIVGAGVTLFGPKSTLEMDTVVQSGAALRCDPKFAVAAVNAKPEEHPYYYSQVQDPYSELKQGTVPASGGGSSEQFNSMTGTPTFTDTSTRVDFAGTEYENAGRYYQYFASGGSEFVVQFDGEYVESDNASRTYTATFSGVHCDLYHTEAHIPCPGHPSKDGTTYCSHHGCPTHATCTENHTVGDTFTWTQSVTGFSYVKITNLKVWKLSEAKLDGTRELLDTDEVTATVKSVAPSLSYNIAGSNTASEGRFIYSWETAQKDTVTIPGYSKPSDNSCTGHTANNQTTLDGDTAGITCSAICVSDFIVLRTSNGDQSILYYEYKSKNEAAINTGGCVAEPIEFDPVPYETIWKNNSQTSEGCGMPEDGVTYGGYNGNYSSMNTKYKSTGHASNIDFNSTSVYKNKSTMSGSWDAVTEKASPKFRLMNDTLIIPDYKQNGEYIVGTSRVFYENIVNFSNKLPNYLIVSQGDFGGRKGFVLETTYSPTHGKINDVVVYNPVSNQNAIVVSLPEERDQRVSTHIVPAVDKSVGCPGDASCPYLENICTVTDHIHTESCYQALEYEVHGPNNVHVHNEDCGPNTTGWRHIHCISGCRDFVGYCTGDRNTCSLCQSNVPFDNNTYPNDAINQSGQTIYLWYHSSGCTYAGQTHRSTSNTACSVCGHTCGSIQGTESTCDGKLNAHVCNAGSGNGELTTGQSKTFNYTGNVQQVTLEPGTYKLEAWGAQGGNSPHGTGGGLGGYSTGQITLTTKTTLYVAVGGQGTETGGGYNGGGPSGASSDSAYGGGATHIASTSGTLSSLSGNKESIYLVAGGGGAGGCSVYGGGAGGGANQNGGNGTGSGSYGSPGGGGTLTGPGATLSGTYAASFGQGGWSNSLYNSGAGGGGYYGGAAGNNVSGGGASGGGGSGYAASSLTNVSGSTGIWSGNGKVVITAVSITPAVQCYTMYKSILSCNDPHHAYSYNWKIYTYGLKHESGKVCTGRECADTTALIFPTQEKYTLAQCAAGYIVQHANGNVHLSTTTGVCSYCGATYKELLSNAQSTDRTPAESEYECYTYGDTRCWQPCGDNSKHQKVVTEVVDNGTTYQMGDFINLDWPFTIYFPNTGDFYGTGAKWSSTTSAERGHGYTNGMDATEWTKTKWVEFPFAVVYNNTTYLAHERIYLEVPKTVFEFYVCLHNDEIANAEVKFGSVAINTQVGNELECGANQDHNIENISYAGKPKAHQHSAGKRTYIDVVGRIGNLTLNDTGDFRYSNLFKTPLSEWLVQNIVKKVDSSKQNYIMLDGVDVRGVNISSTGVAGNTHNTRPERGNINKILNFPLTPAKNNITALQRQPIRVGYDSYFDLTTLGNYYGNAVSDNDTLTQNLVLIKPHYYRLDLDTGDYEPVDVYMDVNGNYVLINDNDSNTVAYNGSDANVNLNWVEEKDRRNYSGSEVTNSNLVADANYWVELPRGSSWVYGNYNILNLTQRNRTFVGSEYTYNDKDDWNSHKDPSDRLPNTLAALQGQRWHFNVGLPSSAVFVYSGQEASKANIDACSSGNAVIFCALEIYSQGEVWTLAYDGSNVNVPFKVTPDGKTYDPYVPYPDSGKNPKGEEMPIVSIISINHSSKEDMDVVGTQ